jgi:hypothetical protein
MEKSNINKWLSKILYERFGLQIIITNHSEDEYYLNIKNNKKKIIISKKYTNFNLDSNKIPNFHWDSSKEINTKLSQKIIPIPGASFIPLPLIKYQNEEIYLKYDILSFVYWMLTRTEELNPSKLDKHERFSAKDSHAYNNGYLERPLVDEWLEILGEIFMLSWPDIKLKKNNFEMCLSHDVDKISEYAYLSWKEVIKTMTRSTLVTNNPSEIFKALFIKAMTKNKLYSFDKCNTFEWIMNESEKRGITSSFFFMANQNKSKYDALYELNSFLVRNLIVKIINRGHVVGLHPSYFSYNDSKLITIEANRLRKIMLEENINISKIGSRMHYLRWKHPDSMFAIINAGLKFDSTLGYADHVGFRCGTCFEYPAFDPISCTEIDLRIKPLIVMEGTVINYMNLGETNAATLKVIELKNKCKMVNGKFELLWHNSYLYNKKLKEMYLNILDA